AGLGLLCSMICLWIGYAIGITLPMNTLRNTITSFDMPDAASRVHIATFRVYHTWYSRLVITNLLAGIALMITQTHLFIKNYLYYKALHQEYLASAAHTEHT
ncbi:MAG: hypothetical protein RML40_12000, partial [Bacteroidota bacterium]|nr:hypothetical protein [Candidatus Kapabacteria bacterium]MDW8221238.1 hypothetical protein [Bacteroidota bacterium]